MRRSMKSCDALSTKNCMMEATVKTTIVVQKIGLRPIRSAMGPMKKLPTIRPTSDAAPIRPSHQESRARAVVARLMEMPMEPRM